MVVSQVMPNVYSSKLQIVRTYDQLREKYGISEKSSEHFEGFLNAMIFVEGLKKPGRDLTRERFRASLESIKSNFGGLFIDFSEPTHSGNKFVELSIVGKTSGEKRAQLIY